MEWMIQMVKIEAETVLEDMMNYSQYKDSFS